MNICAVRTLSLSWPSKFGDIFTIMAHHGKPHEPKSEQRYAVRLIQLDPPPPHMRGGYIGNYAECKHCGSIYEAET